VLPVLIGTHPDRQVWAADCFASIKATTNREILLHTTGGYELAALRTGAAAFDRFLFIHDSVTILDPLFWTVIDRFQTPAWLSGHPPMFMGIHHTSSLKPVLDRYPAEQTKEDAIRIEAELPALLTYTTIWPDITDRTAKRTEERHGRTNLVVGNHLWEKHKGTWR
jgi:hypothetical protein